MYYRKSLGFVDQETNYDVFDYEYEQDYEHLEHAFVNRFFIAADIDVWRI